MTIKRIVLLMMLGFVQYAHPLKTSSATTKNATETKDVELAEWSFLTFIQADSNLSPFAEGNINAMELGAQPTDKVNILVQFDEPIYATTFRYKILPGQRIDARTTEVSEMGYNPKEELVQAVRWMKDNYPAKRYAVTLWNHGNGVEDELPGGYTDTARQIFYKKLYGSWIELPDMSFTSMNMGNTAADPKGILYDYTQETYLSNPGLRQAFIEMRSILGQKVDLVGMDACFMAMLEIAYQIRDLAGVLVGSEEVEPGTGWDYLLPMKVLTENPTISATDLASTIVSAYGTYYNKTSERAYTQSAMNLSGCAAVKTSLEKVVDALHQCKQANSVLTRQLLTLARGKAISFEHAGYVDLYSWYDKLLQSSIGLRSEDTEEVIVPRRAHSDPKLVKPVRPSTQNRPIASAVSAVASKTAWANAVANLRQQVTDAQKAISQLVFANITGSVYNGAGGVSIYYPSTPSSVQGTYQNTQFAQQSTWFPFIQGSF